MPEINLIIGGHSHTKFKKAELLKSDLGKEIALNHAGSLGNTLGRIDLQFENQNFTKISSKNIDLHAVSKNILQG